MALLNIHAHAGVDYVDFTDAVTWVVDPAYSTAAPDTTYRAIEPAKNPGFPIGSWAARPGGGVDIIYTYGGFGKVDTGLTGNYQALSFNISSTGNQDAYWAARVGGGVDYIYQDSGFYFKHDPASDDLDEITYTALSPSKANDTLPLASYGARADGGIDFIYYDTGSDNAVRVDTGITGNYQALAFNDSTVGFDQANWAANVDGGVTYFYYISGTGWLTLPLPGGNLADRTYVALEGAKGSGLYAGTYAARADGGIDLIYLVGDGTEENPYQAVAYNATPLVPGKNYTAIAMDRSGIVPGDFFAAVAETASYEIKITNVAKLSNGSFQIDGTGGPGLTYYLQATSDLTSPLSWVPVTSTIVDGNGLFQFVDPDAVNHTKRFYRVYE